MANAIFTTKVEPHYDDLPEFRYHFPRTYLGQVTAALGDWIIYYEPRRASVDPSSRGGRQVYFATARVEQIVPDPRTPDHFYAYLSDFLPFARPVPFKEGGHYHEASLRKPDGSTNKGAFGRAVRPLPPTEYARILQAGFAHVLGQEDLPRVAPDPPEAPLRLPFGVGEAQAGFDGPAPALAPLRWQDNLQRRLFRDHAFASTVKSAYRDTCALTGLKLINGGGRSEVQAAHIRPVAARGPDSVRNGLALCGTVHWMFDRGLVSLTDDGRVLQARSGIPEVMRRMLPADGHAARPDRPEEAPHPEFLRFHREHVFKG